MTYGPGGGQGGGAGGPYQQWSGYGYEPEPRRGVSGVMIAVIALLTVLVLALLGVAAYLFLRPGGVSGDPTGQAAVASSSSVQPTPTTPATSQDPVTETTYTTSPDRETVTVTRSAEQPSSPGAGYPSGADSSGWTSNTQSRCNAGDPAEMIGRTTQASFSICVNPDNGRYYYRGSAGGSGVEVDDPVVSGASASVRSNSVVYSINSGGMVIYENGEVISSQPMVDFWVR